MKEFLEDILFILITLGIVFVIVAVGYFLYSLIVL